MLRCVLGAMDACGDPYNTANTAIRQMLYTDGYMFAALDSGRQWRCPLGQPDSCDDWNHFQGYMTSLAVIGSTSLAVIGSTPGIVYAAGSSMGVWR